MKPRMVTGLTAPYLHHVLDVATKEGYCQIRCSDATETLLDFKHMALNWRKTERTFKGSIKRKTRQAMMITDYSGQLPRELPLPTSALKRT